MYIRVHCTCVRMVHTLENTESAIADLGIHVHVHEIRDVTFSLLAVPSMTALTYPPTSERSMM